MMKQWQLHWKNYSEKYLQLSSREQYLIVLTGLVAIIFITFHFFIDNKLTENRRLTKQIVQFQSKNKALKISAREFQAALAKDHNEEIKKKLNQYEKKLGKIDTKLLTLTSELISPVQMRQALLELLKIEKGVSLLSFELIGVEPLLKEDEFKKLADSVKQGNISANDSSGVNSGINSDANSDESSSGMNLYRHGIKITLAGRYFALRDYLLQLEQLKWKFFWQAFDLKVTEYPMNELSIEIYSLGSKEAFVGV